MGAAAWAGLQKFSEPSTGIFTGHTHRHGGVPLTFGWVCGRGCVAVWVGFVCAYGRAWWTLAGVFSGGMLGLFLLGFLSRRASRPAALIAVGPREQVFWREA